MTELKEENIQLRHEEHSSTLITGERGTGKTTRAMLVAIEVIRQGGTFLSNIDINPAFLDSVMFSPHLEHWDNVVVRLPDAPHRFALHLEIIGEGWYRQKDYIKYSVMIFDECAIYLNSRSWADEERKYFIDALIHQRKRGYKEFYLAHSLAQIDSQVRVGYITTVELLLNRAPQLSRRWLGGNNPVVCTLKRGSNGDFPTDVNDKKVWTQGLVTTKAYSKSNKTVWNLYNTKQMFDFKSYRSNTHSFVSDGVSVFGFPVHNIFSGYEYISEKTDSRGTLKRGAKQFAFYRPGSYALISPRLLVDCYYVQSLTLKYFTQQQQFYALSKCLPPVFSVPKNVTEVKASAGLDTRYNFSLVAVFVFIFAVIGGFLYFMGFAPTFFTSSLNSGSAPAPVAVDASPVSSVQPDGVSTERFKKPAGKPFATYPVCEFFNVLEEDRVTWFDKKHLLDRDWLLQYLRSHPVKVTNFFIDQATGMPRYSLLFYSDKTPATPIDSASELELFNYGWRSAMTGYKNSFLTIYNPNIWIFFPVSNVNMIPSSSGTSSSIFSLDKQP